MQHGRARLQQDWALTGTPRLQEEERERRMDYVPEESAVSTKLIQVGSEKHGLSVGARMHKLTHHGRRSTLTRTTCSRRSTCPTCRAWRRSRCVRCSLLSSPMAGAHLTSARCVQPQQALQGGAGVPGGFPGAYAGPGGY